MRPLLTLPLVLLLAAWQAQTQSQATTPVTTPEQAFGARIGDDYFLATYSQLESYWQQLDRQSDRMVLTDIGPTAEGRPQWMAIVSAPENIRALDRYREISRRLALAEDLDEATARRLAAEGRAVVVIAGGIHGNEVLGGQQLIELVYQMVSRSDAEMLRFLRDVIVLAIHANPDGHERVARWYMREANPRARTLDGLPLPYHKYVGHDINRDFYLSSQAETTNMNRVLYREWFPQLVLDHHQSSPPGTVMFAPPFRPPFNYVFDPLIPIGIELVGATMHARFAAEGKPGVTMRNGSTYSAWWNGGLRTTTYFHNQIGLLTETTGGPTPSSIPFVADRQVPSADLPFPIAPQPWHFRQSVEYALTANWAVIDAASRFRETVLLNAYRMARNSIDRGSRDTWTMSPSRLERLASERPGRALPAEVFESRLRDPAQRDARAYILPADQPDFLTATRFVDALIKAGVQVHRATAPFEVNGRRYPAGSYVVKTAQAFRPYVLDMFEPQDHPNDVAYPGGPPVPPYDHAGWTLAFQMGVKFDRVLDGFEGPFEPLTSTPVLRGRIEGPESRAGYLLSHHQNDAFVAVNRLLAAGADVYWLRDRSIGYPGTGAIYIASTPSSDAVVRQAANDLGLAFMAVAVAPAGPALKLAPPRAGLWDRYGGAPTSGWTRWMFEQYEFPHALVFAPRLDAGDLRAEFDVIILPGEATLGGNRNLPAPARVPQEYHGMLGSMSRDRTVPQLRRFVEDGGTLVAIGPATSIAAELGLPVTSALVAATASGGTRALSPSEFYVPGSVLRVRVNPDIPLGFGFEAGVDVFFERSPAFHVPPRAAEAGIEVVAWFDSPAPLRSGWAHGQERLQGAAAVLDVRLGRGRVLLFGPEINYRAQPHGTFKFLFNAVHLSRATPVHLPDGSSTARASR